MIRWHRVRHEQIYLYIRREKVQFGKLRRLLEKEGLKGAADLQPTKRCP